MPKKAEVLDTSPDAPIDYDAALTELGAEKKLAPKKKAEPKPGAADYDWSQNYPEGVDLYTYTFPSGTVVAIKTFGAIYSKTWLYKIRNLQSDADIEFAAIDRAACDVAREVLMSLDDTVGDPINDLWKAWVADGTSNGEGDEGLTPGK